MNKTGQCVLADLTNLLGVTLVLNKGFKQTLCFGYFTELILGSFGNGPVNKSRHYVLAILLGLL